MIESLEFIALFLTVAGGIVINYKQNQSNHKDMLEKATKDKTDTDTKYAVLSEKVEANKDEIAKLHSEMRMEFAKCHQHCRNTHGGDIENV